MPDPLPNDAPAEEPEAPSVEVDAPGDQGEVESGSTAEAVVPASRFNGLMSSFNKMKADQQALLNELEALRNQPKETPQVSEDIQAELRALRQELQQERLENAKTKVLEKYPEAKEFADLFVSNSPEEMESLAQDISNRVKRLLPQNSGEQPKETEEETPPAPKGESAPPAQEEPPVNAGGASIPPGSPAHERVQEAIKKRSWSDYLNAKYEAMGDAGQLEGVELSA